MIRSAARNSAAREELRDTLRDHASKVAESKEQLDEENKFHFERPLVAIDGKPIWRGCPDLIVEFPGLDLAIIAFKAGKRFATASEIPGIEGYAAR